MNRDTLLELWNAAWDGESWIAPWARAIDLPPPQAAWIPPVGGPRRHSIWQIVGHVTFWRGVTMNTLAGKDRPSPEEISAGNFPAPTAVAPAAWQQAKDRLAESHRRIAGAIADPTVNHERLRHHLYHDAYHLGQIMYVRALQGMPPIE